MMQILARYLYLAALICLVKTYRFDDYGMNFSTDPYRPEPDNRSVCDPNPNIVSRCDFSTPCPWSARPADQFLLLGRSGGGSSGRTNRKWSKKVGTKKVPELPSLGLTVPAGNGPAAVFTSRPFVCAQRGLAVDVHFWSNGDPGVEIGVWGLVSNRMLQSSSTTAVERAGDEYPGPFTYLAEEPIDEPFQIQISIRNDDNDKESEVILDNIRVSGSLCEKPDVELCRMVNSDIGKGTTNSDPVENLQDDICRTVPCNFQNGMCSYTPRSDSSVWAVESGSMSPDILGFLFNQFGGAKSLLDSLCPFGMCNTSVSASNDSPDDKYARTTLIDGRATKRPAVVTSRRFRPTQTDLSLSLRYFNPDEVQGLRVCFEVEGAKALEQLTDFEACPAETPRPNLFNMFNWLDFQTTVPRGTFRISFVAMYNQNPGLLNYPVAIDDIKVSSC